LRRLDAITTAMAQRLAASRQKGDCAYARSGMPQGGPERRI
jgi:hypothetical protein